MKRPTAWGWCAAAGLFAFAAVTALRVAMAKLGCASPEVPDPVLMLEFARSPADVMAMLAPCPGPMRHAQQVGLWIDTLGFVPGYTLFLVTAGFAIRRPTATLAMAFAILAALSDEAENALLLAILGAPVPPVALFGPLAIAVPAKFALLSVAEMLIGGALLRSGLTFRIAGLAMIAGGAVSLPMLFIEPRGGLMTGGHTLALVALLVAALVAALRPALAPGRTEA